MSALPELRARCPLQLPTYDKIRYNHMTEEYAILSADNYVRNDFIPDPADHGFPTNLDYFRWDCRRVKG
jgi:hypothetical protein